MTKTKEPVVPEITSAVRTVSETDDVHVIEGRIAFGGPFGGRDTYGTTFSARTDWGLDLHPSGIPVLFNHGFDADFGLAPIGRTNPTASFRQDADGIWVEMQLDKRQKYYTTRIKPLLEASALGVSQGSAEHSVRIDARTGEVLAWPLHEISLTPIESNPWSIVAARSAETLRIVAARTEPTRAYSEAASDAAMGAGALGTLLYLLSCEADEPEQVAMIQCSIDALTEWLTAERAEVGTPDDMAESMPAMAVMSGIRTGKRNSAVDQSRIDAIHEAIMALGPTSHANDLTAEPADDAARSGDTRTDLRIVAGPATVDPEVARAYAAQVGEQVALRFVERLRT